MNMLSTINYKKVVKVRRVKHHNTNLMRFVLWCISLPIIKLKSISLPTIYYQDSIILPINYQNLFYYLL